MTYSFECYRHAARPGWAMCVYTLAKERWIEWLPATREMLADLPWWTA